MSFWQRIRGEFIDIIEWLDDTPDTMVYRFERYDNEIKNGAKLIVREGQAAIFVNEGQLADVFGPGTITLETQNLPILSTLKGWKYGFDSPFKAEVYFVSTRQFTDQKWGTKNPIMLRDPEFGPMRLRAFGTYTVRVSEPATFLREVVGTSGHFSTDGITDQLRNLVVSRFTDALAESKLAALDLAANYDELGSHLLGVIQPDFQQYGLELKNLLVENISLPPEVEQVLDQRTSMGVIGNLGAYTQFMAAKALAKSAENPGAGGLAASGLGMGMGMAMANQMGQTMQSGTLQGGAAMPPPPPPAAVQYHLALDGQTKGPYTLDTLRDLVQQRTVTAETMVWAAGMSGWTKAGEVADLRSLLQQVPPPLPPVG